MGSEFRAFNITELPQSTTESLRDNARVTVNVHMQRLFANDRKKPHNVWQAAEASQQLL